MWTGYSCDQAIGGKVRSEEAHLVIGVEAERDVDLVMRGLRWLAATLRSKSQVARRIVS